MTPDAASLKQSINRLLQVLESLQEQGIAQEMASVPLDPRLQQQPSPVMRFQDLKTLVDRMQITLQELQERVKATEGALPEDCVSQSDLENSNQRLREDLYTSRSDFVTSSAFEKVRNDLQGLSVATETCALKTDLHKATKDFQASVQLASAFNLNHGTLADT